MNPDRDYFEQLLEDARAVAERLYARIKVDQEAYGQQLTRIIALEAQLWDLDHRGAAR
jgi:hypothetical protein